jgi:hypothetical protein
MRIIGYKMMTHARMVGFVRFKDGNRLNYNKTNLCRVDLNYVINDIIDKKDHTNWDIVLNEEERNYIKKHPNELIKFIYSE